MKNNDNFDINSFASPDASYAPVYVWVWNDICDRDIIDNQLAEMLRLGIRAFYILPEPKSFRPDSMPTSLEPDYLTEEYFALCAYAVEKAETLGMLCWIYDEGGWPSGGACGRVLQEHPEDAQQELKAYGRSFKAGEVYTKTTPDVLAAFVNEIEMIEDGCQFLADTAVTEYAVKKENGGNAWYPDLLNKKTTEHFIGITHEKYAYAMKNALGKSVTAVFTDEPKAPSRAFNKELAEKYEALYGESVLPYLPLIAQSVAPTKENVHVLYRWYDLCSRMFCDNFLLPCKEWANAHGMAFTGHLDKDHDPLGCIRGGGNFNLMRALRCFDIPGVDVIRRQLYPEDRISDKDDMNAYNGFYPRYASSAAAQNGTKLAMSEIFGVAGADLTYDIMRYTVGYQAVRGINIFNLFNFPLGRKGQLLAQELPIFTENQVYYRYLNQFNRYIERLSYLSSLGERVCETGLYYPVHDFVGGINADCAAKSFDTLGRELEKMTVDFDIVDDDAILNSDGADEGCIRIGRAEYRSIIIPEGVFVPEATQKVFERFVKGGGRLVRDCSELAPVIRIDSTGLCAMHRKTENADLFFLFRESGEKDEFRVHLPSSKGYLLDLENGTLQHLEAENGILQISLAVGETAVILLTDEALNAEKKKAFSEIFDIPNSFTLRKELELVCNENGFESIKHSEKPVPVSLGDWSDLFGSDYSGSGVYEIRFALPAEKVGREGELDLGDVRYAAEVQLNGKLLGTALMPPYRLNIPADILKENNTLEITVTNTCANWYIGTDYFDKWKTQELSPYFEDELTYAKDYASGGLYGPVRLYTQT